MIPQETGRIASTRGYGRAIKTRVRTKPGEPKPRFSKHECLEISPHAYLHR